MTLYRQGVALRNDQWPMGLFSGEAKARTLIPPEGLYKVRMTAVLHPVCACTLEFWTTRVVGQDNDPGM
eukprot:1160055-Pelagomonas_calceolata.AAC.4